MALVGCALGDDEYGRLLRALFARDAPELDLRFVTTQADAHTPYCVCIATPDGHRTMYGTGFSEMQSPLLDPELARVVPLFTMDPNAWNPGKRAALAAARAGAAVTAMDYTFDASVSQAAHLNLTSRAHLGPDRSLPELAARATALRDTYLRAAIVTCGDQGCFVAEAGQEPGWPATHIPAYTAPELIDSTGAGDVFRADLLYGQIKGWDLLTTVRFAAAAASLNCGAMGGWGGVRTVQEILEFQRA